MDRGDLGGSPVEEVMAGSQPQIRTGRKETQLCRRLRDALDGGAVGSLCECGRISVFTLSEPDRSRTCMSVRIYFGSSSEEGKPKPEAIE